MIKKYCKITKGLFLTSVALPIILTASCKEEVKQTINKEPEEEKKPEEKITKITEQPKPTEPINNPEEPAKSEPEKPSETPKAPNNHDAKIKEPSIEDKKEPEKPADSTSEPKPSEPKKTETSIDNKNQQRFEIQIRNYHQNLETVISKRNDIKKEATYKYEAIVDDLDKLEEKLKYFNLNFDNLQEIESLNSYTIDEFKRIDELINNLKNTSDSKPTYAVGNFDKNAQKVDKDAADLDPLQNYPELDAINRSLKSNNTTINAANAFINNQAIQFAKFAGSVSVPGVTENGYTDQKKELVRQFVNSHIIKNSNMTLKEKMRAIFDWITSNVKYATGSSHPAIEPHEVMTRLVAVCGGYSTLYKAMLDIIGIKNVMVAGWSAAGAHQWNIVEDPETHEWFHSDATWGSVNNKYYNLSSEAISPDHRVDTIIDLSTNHEGIEYRYWHGLSVFNSTNPNTIVPDSVSNIKVESIFNDLFNNDKVKTLSVGRYVNRIGYRGGSHNLVSFEVNSENPNFSARDGILYRNNFIEILSTPGQNPRTEIVIPKETSDLRDGKEIFNTPNLRNIVVESGNYSFASYKGILYNNDFTQIISVPAGLREYFVKGTVNLQGQEFSFKDRVNKIVLEEGITSIPESTFNQLNNLREVHLPNSITSISPYAFNQINHVTLITKEFNQVISDFAKQKGFTYRIDK
ncbi:transglutaminase domain-containing protein [Mycoplasmopsis felis]|uniref:transglutaminase domain-containing protein n=1 Tax=Mycoplasmopsis felis TaxID=33923 RepID=UPI002AFE2FFC|nr:leucine-rich repeat protein [Mycoplasmopsis felis]WQQ06827.1 leucine-rich repeat protein [Mycoplasmopsis felis]